MRRSSRFETSARAAAPGAVGPAASVRPSTWNGSTSPATSARPSISFIVIVCFADSLVPIRISEKVRLVTSRIGISQAPARAGARAAHSGDQGWDNVGRERTGGHGDVFSR